MISLEEYMGGLREAERLAAEARRAELAATLSCEDLKIAATGESCCISCHEDDTEWGFDLFEKKLPDGRTVRVCCAMLRNLEAEGL